MADENNKGAGEQNLEPNDQNKTTFTKEEVDALLQSNGDKRVSEALKTARAKWDKEAGTKLREAEKLGKMDEDQRKDYDLQQALKKIEQMEIDKAKSENTQETLKVLSNRSLPASLLDFVLTDNAETTLERISEIQTIITSLVNAEVDKRLPKGTVPKSGNINKTITKEEFSKMTVTQLQELAHSNPELFKSLSNVKK